jgi:hypothetical protein
MIPQASLQFLASNLIGLNEDGQTAVVLGAEKILKQQPARGWPQPRR